MTNSLFEGFATTIFLTACSAIVLAGVCAALGGPGIACAVIAGVALTAAAVTGQSLLGLATARG